MKKVSVHHGCENETTNNSSQIWYKVQMHKVSLNGSASCCSWRCLHVVVTLVSNYPFKAEESPIPSVSFMVGKKNVLLQAEVDMMGTYIILNTYTTAEGLWKPIICKYLILAWNGMRMIWVSTHIRQPKKDKLEGKRSRNLLKLTLRIEEEMNNRCIITKRGYQFH